FSAKLFWQKSLARLVRNHPGFSRSLMAPDLPEASKGEGEGGRVEANLGLDKLITAELNAVDQRRVRVVGDGDGGGDLAEQGDDGLAGVAANDGDGELRGGLAGDLGDKGLGADDVEGGDTEEALGVEDVVVLEHLGSDGHGRVDRVGDDEDVGLGGDL